MKVAIILDWHWRQLKSGRPLQAARAAVGDAADRPKIIAVTVLTSLDSNDLSAAGFAGDTATTASKLANSKKKIGIIFGRTALSYHLSYRG